MGEVDPGHLRADATSALHRRVDCSPRGPPAQQAHDCVVISHDGCRRNIRRNASDLGGAQVHHLLVVGRVVADVAGAVFLLDAANTVHQSRRPRNGPGASQRHGVAQVRPEFGGAVVGHVIHLRLERHRDVGQRIKVGQQPRLTAVGQESVAEQDDRRAVLQRDTSCLDRGIETLRRAVRGDDRQRRLTVTTEHRDVQVGGFGLGRQTRRRATALNVDDQQRQLQRDAQADGFALQRQARATGGCDAEMPRERSAERHTDCRNLVLRLHRTHAEMLVLGQFVQDIAGRCNRVTA